MRIYDHAHMQADLAFVNSWKPLLPRRRFRHMVRWWGCMLRWLRWVEQHQPVAYAFFIIHNRDYSQYSRAIAYAARKGRL